MNDHVHELYTAINLAGRIVGRCKDSDCSYWLTTEAIDNRLNAAERLSAGQAEAVAHCDCEFDEDKDALLAYAKARCAG